MTENPYMQQTRMRIIYVAGPYRSDHSWGIEINTQRALQYARWVMSVHKDVIAICPHVNTKSMDGNLIGHNQILDGYLEMISRCLYDAVHVLPGWQDSEGTKAEIAAAHASGTNVEYVERAALQRIIEQQMFRGLEMA